ncbi:MAG: carboxypeptidase regulatory-like domain-containing protein [Planctomycetota bacterium]
MNWLHRMLVTLFASAATLATLEWTATNGEPAQLETSAIQKNNEEFALVPRAVNQSPVPGEITGTVFDNRRVPIASASVNAYRPNREWMAGAGTDTSGSYMFSLPPGEYVLDAWGPQETYFTQQTYNGLSGNVWTRDNWQNATRITVAEGSTTAGIDFALGIGGRIHGYVRDSDNAGLAGVSVSAYDSDGRHVQGTGPDDESRYSFAPLEPGTYYIDAEPYLVGVSCLSAATSYDDHTGAFYWYSCHGRQDELQTVVVQPRLDVGPVGFVLPPGGAISGWVTESDGVTPLSGAWVGVFDESLCLVSYTFTQIDGTFVTCGVPPGQYILTASELDCSYFTPQTYNALLGYPWMYDNWANAARILVREGETVSNINFALPEGGTIEGKVTEQDGTTWIEGATIILRESDQSWGASTTTNVDGTYVFCSLPAGEYVLEAWGPEGAYFTQRTYAGLPGNLWTRDNWQRATRIPVVAGETVSEINFALDRGGRILGTVILPDGGAVSDGNVFVQAYDEYGWHIAGTETGAEGQPGNYAFTLDPGRYYLNVFMHGNAAAEYCFLAPVTYDGHAGAFTWYNCNGRLSELEAVQVLLEQDVPDVDFVMPAGGTISGYVSQSDGVTPIADADVNVYDENGCWVANTRSLSDGTYTICNVPSGEDILDAWGPEGTYFTQQTYAGLAGNLNTRENRQYATRVTVVPGETTPDIDFALGLGGRILGTVLVSNQEVVSNATVQAFDEDGSHIQGVGTDWSGNYALTLDPGAYYLNVLAFGAREDCRLAPVTYDGHVGVFNMLFHCQDQGDILQTVQLQAEQDVAGIDFQLPTGGSIGGRVTETDGTTPIPNAQVVAWDHASGCWFTDVRTRSDGTYIFCGAPAGQYVMEARPPDGAAYQVETYQNLTGWTWCDDNWANATRIAIEPGGSASDINFNLDPPPTLSITVREPPGPPGSCFSAGDTITVDWTSDARGGDLYVYVMQDGGYRCWLGSAPVTNGTLTGTIAGCLGSGVYVVSAWLNTSCSWITADSDEFCITGSHPVGTFEVTQPSAGARLPAGSEQVFAWTADDPCGEVYASLVSASDYCYLGSAPMEQGQMFWTVPISPGNGDDYQILVQGYQDPCVVAETESGLFSIVDTPALHLTFPNGGEVLTAGSTYNVTWDPLPDTGSVGLGLKKGGEWLCWIGDAEPSAGTFPWTVTQFFENSGDYTVEICLSESCDYGPSGRVCDDSDAPFTIGGGASPPTITITFPPAGDTWRWGSEECIIWTVEHPHPETLVGADALVYVLWDYGGAYTIVYEAAVPFLDGHLCLELACAFEEGSNYVIAIASDECWIVSAWSDGLFSVGPALPDADADSDVDLMDYAAFVDCADGPGVFPDPTPPMTGQGCLNAFDACGDGDVDLFDFGIVQRKFTASP